MHAIVVGLVIVGFIIYGLGLLCVNFPWTAAGITILLCWGGWALWKRSERRAAQRQAEKETEDVKWQALLEEQLTWLDEAPESLLQQRNLLKVLRVNIRRGNLTVETAASILEDREVPYTFEELEGPPAPEYMPIPIPARASANSAQTSAPYNACGPNPYTTFIYLNTGQRVKATIQAGSIIEAKCPSENFSSH